MYTQTETCFRSLAKVEKQAWIWIRRKAVWNWAYALSDFSDKYLAHGEEC